MYNNNNNSNGGYGTYPYSTYMPTNGYNMYNPQPTMTAPITQQMSFVNGLAGAQGFIVPPNTSMFLMDSDSEQFFIKVADKNGMCNIKAYEFKEKIINKETPTSSPSFDESKFVTREEFNTFIASVTKATNNAAAEPIKSATTIPTKSTTTLI